MMTRAFLIAALALAGWPAQAGELRGSGLSMSWRSTDCRTPHPPYVGVANESGRRQLERFAAEIDRYKDCLRDEAERDQRDHLSRVRSAMQTGVRDAEERADDALSRAWSDYSRLPSQ
ncbi:MAG: hypothetical protein MI723_17270 [Caulobacterales bacterium]|nr:hypothetical protein [Caulobacterales bacterium]